MARFLRSRMVQDEAVAAGAALRTDDLPVNPLSVIYYTLRAQAAAANTLASVANLLAVMSRVEIVYKGQNILSASLADLYALAYYKLGRAPHQLRKSDAAANARIGITVPILLGRSAYDSKSCFPAVRRGELQLQSTPAAAFTNLANVTLQIETLELPEATPADFAKATTISKTPTAVGDHDVDLPIGNPIDGIILFSTTVPVDGADIVSINQLRLLLDNVEYDYALTNWETLKGHEALWCDADWQGSEGSVRTGAAIPAANELLEAYQWPTAFLRQYAYLPFPTIGADDYLLQTAGRARIHLRIDAGDVQPIRVIPVERIAVAATTPVI